MSEIIRCAWANSDPLYIEYHDKEWGVPQHDPLILFEMLCLEGAQAGLSWITILKKRPAYRKAFAKFDPKKIAKFDDAKIESLMQNAGIVRNRLKINAFISNAKAYLKMQKDGEDFAKYIWSFVNNKTIINNWKKISKIPTTSKESEAMSKDLKKRGFKFVGPTICYAFMQAIGMVDDHIVDCHKRNLKF